jgi:hypothetical protein
LLFFGAAAGLAACSVVVSVVGVVSVVSSVETCCV